MWLKSYPLSLHAASSDPLNYIWNLTNHIATHISRAHLACDRKKTSEMGLAKFLLCLVEQGGKLKLLMVQNWLKIITHSVEPVHKKIRKESS